MSDQYPPPTGQTPRPPHPSQPYAPPPIPQYYGPPPRETHLLRYVLLALAVVAVLFIGGCAAFFGVVFNEVDNAIEEEKENDKPVAVAEGKAFERDGFEVAAGWKVVSRIGGMSIDGMRVTLQDDQDAGRMAQFTFSLYDADTVAVQIDCSSNEMQAGESSAMRCTSMGSEIDVAYDAIKVADMW